VKLGEIPNVAYMLSSRTRSGADELKLLHRLLFGSVGKEVSRKRHLREFSGFVFSSEAEEGKVRDKLGKLTNDQLKAVCAVLDLPSKGNKETMVRLSLDFLKCPSVNDARRDRKMMEAGMRKRKRANERKRRKRERGAGMEGEDEDEEDEDEGDEEDKDEEEEGDEDGKEVSEGGGGGEDKGAAKDRKGGNGIQSKAMKKNKTTTKIGSKDGAQLSPKEDADAEKEIITDDELKDKILTVLRSADLSQLSVKKLRKQLEEDLGYSLEQRMNLVRQTVEKAMAEL